MDRISLSFPIHDKADEMAWDLVSHVPRNGLATKAKTVDVDEARWFVGVKEIERADGERMWWAKVEGNPSRTVDPAGHSLCPVRELRPVLAPVLELVTGELVSASCSMDEARVKRLDVARDFGDVKDVPALLVGLAGVHRPWSRKNNLYNDGTRHGAQTLMVGSGAGTVRLYDKFAETCGAVPEGQLRWETEARSAWLAQYAGVEQLADLNPITVNALAHDRWEWSGMGHEVCTRSQVVARVMAAGLPVQTRRGFLGWLMENADGFSTVSKNTATKYRKLARDLGVALGPELLNDAQVGRLDWEQGTVITRAA